MAGFQPQNTTTGVVYLLGGGGGGSTITSVVGTAHQVTVTGTTDLTLSLPRQLIIGDDVGISLPNAAIVCVSDSDASAFYVGQASDRSLVFIWRYNADPDLADAVLTTYGNNNDLTIKAKNLIFFAGGGEVCRFDVGGAFIAQNGVISPAVQFSPGGSTILGLTDGQFTIVTSAEDHGVTLQVASDKLAVRTIADDAYATVDALGYQVGGVSGANFGPGLATSITVVNGLVTAAA